MADHVRPGEGSPDDELIRLCDRLVEIAAAEKKIHDELGEDDAACDAALKPYGDEWRTMEERLPDLGKLKTLAGDLAMAQAAPLKALSR